MSGPLFAMDTTPRRSCALSGWNSSGNMPPQIDAPPLPVPVGSPVWTMNPGSSRWKRHPSYLRESTGARSRGSSGGRRAAPLLVRSSSSDYSPSAKELSTVLEQLCYQKVAAGLRAGRSAGRRRSSAAARRRAALAAAAATPWPRPRSVRDRRNRCRAAARFPDAHSARKLNEQRGAVSQNSSSFKSPTPVWSVTAIAGGVARSRDGERRLITLQRVSQRRRGGTAAAPRLHVAAARVARGPRFVQFTCQFAWH